MSEMDPKVRKGLDDLLTFVRQEIDRGELANEAFGTTCVDCGRAIGDEDETAADGDGNLLHVGCGDRS